MNKPKSIDLILYIFVLILAYEFKNFYSQADVSELKFILSPTSTLVEWMTGLEFLFSNTIGYCNEETNIVINKTCAGVNFFIIAFSMSICSFIHCYQNIKTKLCITVLLFTFSYFLTIAVNSFRISSAISLLKIINELPLLSSAIAHDALGILFYFFFLSCFYLSLKFFTQKSSIYENSIKTLLGIYHS
jgi:exosortase K